MAKPSRQTLEDLRGLAAIIVNSTMGTSKLVEAMHNTIERVHPPIGESKATSTSGISGLVYKTIRSTSKTVGTSFDLSMQAVAPFLDDSTQSSPTRDVFLSVINGVYGDKLVEQNNALAIDMRFIFDKQPLQFNKAESPLKLQVQSPGSDKIMLFIHGLCMSHYGWEVNDKNQSEQLAKVLGFTPVYLHYNTGKSIASNGEMLAQQLEMLIEQWPTSITDLSLVGHSMGGLVARSAHFYGTQYHKKWLAKTTSIISIGTPHNGAMLEKGGAVIDALLTLSPYAVPFTRLTGIRSQGIEDLRHGKISASQDAFIPIPDNVRFYALAGVLNKTPNKVAEQSIGDGLVTLNSAFGISKQASKTLAIPEHHKWLKYNLSHNAMLSDPDVFNAIANWLKPYAS